MKLQDRANVKYSGRKYGPVIAARVAKLEARFLANRGKTLTVAQVRETVGAGYFRKVVSELVENDYPLIVVTEGRKVIGWELPKAAKK